MNITALKSELIQSVETAKDLNELDQARVNALGKKGRITELMKNMGSLSVEERKTIGAELNLLKDEIAELIARQETALKRQEMDNRLANETIDITLSPRPERTGSIHPISQTIDEMIEPLPKAPISKMISTISPHSISRRVTLPAKCMTHFICLMMRPKRAKHVRNYCAHTHQPCRFARC